MKQRCVAISSTLALLLVLFVATTAPAQTAPAWQPNHTYAVNELVTFNGQTFKCIQGHTSQVGWEPPNVPALWALVAGGGGGGCSSVPSAPTGLQASSTTSTGTTLSWIAAGVGTGCTVTSYTVFQNGAVIGNSTTTSFQVAGLTPSTTFSFRIAANDSFGVSAQSAAINVTTTAADGGSGCADPWISTQVYTGGMKASVNGVNYLANFWTQGDNPTTHNGGPGSGQPWTSEGPCAPCTAAPGAPTGLTASNTTGTSTNLSWNAPSVASNCAITSYTVFKNGSSIGTSAGTNFVVTSLTPQTTFSFRVAATNGVGTGPQSAALSVTTGTGTGGGGNKLFAPYIDMGLGNSSQLLTIQQQSGIKFFTLGFIVDNGSCAPQWGGLGQTLPNDSLPNGTTMSSLVQGVRNAGGDVIISFGGAFGTELAHSTACRTASQVQAGYQAVINKYHPLALDFDIEGPAVNSPVRSDGVNSVDLRNQALANLAAANPGLKIHFTLPVLPTGLIPSGFNVLQSIARNRTPVAVVNVMAMDYGSANDNGGQMGLSATQAAQNVHTQIQSAGLNASVGVTPMIGVNDTNTEIFTLSDAQMLLDFANSNSFVTRLSLWSVSRDNGGCPNAGFASATCSGISQTDFAFSRIFEAFR
ncbi:MAG TPA: carbohydrate-binding protein [Pyrinomonadaceae bacterium]